MAVNRELLESTINVIRQSLQADGGDLALIDVTDDGVVTLEMQGACAGKMPLPGHLLATKPENAAGVSSTDGNKGGFLGLF